MPLTRSEIDLVKQGPKGWRRLWEEAQRETDPKRLDAIIKRMNLLLTEQEQKSGRRAA
ncbi:MAG TPA: hypothetical protein VK579_20400 [Terriglobales bacterium]|jgi:hypothetical protein|nr:hypothetical protein [Terriglobales bacterium]